MKLRQIAPKVTEVEYCCANGYGGTLPGFVESFYQGKVLERVEKLQREFGRNGRVVDEEIRQTVHQKQNGKGGVPNVLQLSEGQKEVWEKLRELEAVTPAAKPAGERTFRRIASQASSSATAKLFAQSNKLATSIRSVGNLGASK